VANQGRVSGAWVPLPLPPGATSPLDRILRARASGSSCRPELWCRLPVLPIRSRLDLPNAATAWISPCVLGVVHLQSTGYARHPKKVHAFICHFYNFTKRIATREKFSLRFYPFARCGRPDQRATLEAAREMTVCPCPILLFPTRGPTQTTIVIPLSKNPSWAGGRRRRG
jgi:hypothetical protein